MRLAPRLDRRPTLAAVAAVAVVVAASSASPAGAQAFTFEGMAPFGAHSLTFTSGAEELTVTPEGGTPDAYVYVWDTSTWGSALGTRALLTNGQGGSTPIRFSFLQPVTAIAFRFGDASPDNDSPVILSAFDAGGLLLDTHSAAFVSGASMLTFDLSAAPASYFIGSSGGAVPNSVAWEIAASTAAPSAVLEPGTVALLATGLVAVGGAAARRRRLA